MKTRFIHSLYLTPAVLLLLMWIATASAIVVHVGPVGTLIAALVSAITAGYCITLFAHAVRRDLP